MDKPAGAPAVDWGVGQYERTAEMLLPAAQVLVDAASPGPGERVLDVGCGTGNAALLAAAPGARVTAVDPSPRLLDVTRAAAHERGLDVTCEVGDAAALPAPDRSFNCVVSNFGIIFAPDPHAAAAEVARVLAAGGRALFTAWLPGGGIGALAATAQELVRDAMGAPPAPPGFPWHDASAVADLFDPHGMAAAVVGRHELPFTASSPAAFLEAEFNSHPLAVSGHQVLQQAGKMEQARERLLKVLTDHNEDPEHFRCTSQYVVLSARPTDPGVQHPSREKGPEPAGHLC